MLYEAMLIAFVELKEAVETYKTKTDSYLQRLEEAEIAKAKAVRAEAFGASLNCRCVELHLMTLCTP
jgi:hypothetical protein